jgi:hypothetical protein
VTDLLVRDLHVSEVEVDELWSFVGQKGGSNRPQRKAIIPRQKSPGNAGAA